MADILAGKTALADAPIAIQSQASWHIYNAACDILQQDTKEARREALARHPDMIRPHIEAEALRLWSRRKNDPT